MLKIVSIVIIIGVVGGVVFTLYVRETQPLTAYETKTIRIGNAELEVFVADTTEKRTRGLMNISKLGADAGMIFIFPDASSRTFWNKNTLVSLDLIWIADGQVMGVSMLPAITQSGDIVYMSSPGAVNDVVEANAGWAAQHGIKAGDMVAK